MSSQTKIENEFVIDEDAVFKKKYVLYKITITFNKFTWFVQRRYSEFHILFKQLKKNYPEIPLDIPPKALLNDFDPNFIKNRADGLSSFIDSILHNSVLLNDFDVVRFLDLDKISGKSEIKFGPDIDHPKNIETLEKDKNVSPLDFDYLKVIGKVNFGQVLLTRHKVLGSIFAVKVIFKSQLHPSHLAETMMERHIQLKTLKHPFLCRLHNAFQTSSHLYFVFQYAYGGDLFFHLQQQRIFSEEQARFYAAEIASALGYLHNKNIIYRNLKPTNILLDSRGHVVLTDFGLCKHLESKVTTHTFCGTPEYSAPEVILEKPYTNLVDWWGLGIVLYEMLFGATPFYSIVRNQMYHNIAYGVLRLRSPCSAEAAFILYGLLEKNPEKRLGYKTDFEEVRDQGFFFGINWKALEERRLEPPIIPKLSSETDTSYIDEKFTQQAIDSSIFEEMGKQHDIKSDDQFNGNANARFSFVSPIIDDDE